MVALIASLLFLTGLALAVAVIAATLAERRGVMMDALLGRTTVTPPRSPMVKIAVRAQPPQRGFRAPPSRAEVQRAAA